MSLLSRVFDALDRRKFERVFSGGEDPYRYEAVEFERRRFGLMLSMLSGRRYGHALEVGCAEGALTERLAALADRVTAMDISQAALDRAASRLAARRGVELVRASLADFDPGHEGFDLVVVSEVLYYLGERNDFLRAIGAAGRRLDHVLSRLAGALRAGGRLLLAHSHGPGRRASREEYRRRLEALGLRLEREEAVPPTGEPGTDCCLVSLLVRPVA